jgi:hypothetical protein
VVVERLRREEERGGEVGGGGHGAGRYALADSSYR